VHFGRKIGFEGLLSSNAIDIPDVRLIETPRFMDERGYFSETYNQAALREAGIEDVFVQDNMSLSRAAGVVRGLHFQRPPHAQAKLVRVVHGRILDVAVDLRRGSPTYGRHIAKEISAENWRQLFVPIGFAHGFVTLVPDTEVMYKVSDYYAPQHEGGLLWNDPALGIDWDLGADAVVLSGRDRNWPTLAELTDELPF
jgi:dTDP-4-dehydrorhamnose 3,5-epimerase